MGLNQQPDDVLLSVLKSDFFKTLVTIITTTLTMSYFIFSATSQIKDQIKDIQYNIVINNNATSYRLKAIEDRQDRDIKFIQENFVKKQDMKK